MGGGDRVNKDNGKTSCSSQKEKLKGRNTYMKPQLQDACKVQLQCAAISWFDRVMLNCIRVAASSHRKAKVEEAYLHLWQLKHL